MFLNMFQNLTSSDFIILGGIQIFLLVLFIFMVSYFCKLLRKKEPGKNIRKTCILVWFLSAIAWFIIAQIVWIITSLQYS